ncbi:preprotein translocase subunit YajC [Thiospirillum jenense]|uniref:Sec translocon accessory complex subunit YajC n=1 Tax=Thiospirillum jenense TaxID=1653858 RepID=A0A839HEH4_9GAMM|nr:preprotein translocase subunit YajC [Thiospirillum jenense]MBB1127061.1 preprotein translocase subunit YajC [Thiospirillum jenense]
MNWLISDALAQTAPAPAGSAWGSLLLPIVLIVVLYFVMIRPQVKRQKEHKALIDGLVKGDEVVTLGGMTGRIVDLGDNFVRLEVADNVIIKVRRLAIEAVLPKGSLKEL